MSTLTKKPIHVYLRSEQLEALRRMALQRDVPIAELIRQGVDRLLDEAPVEKDPLWDIVGMADSGLGDLAEKHDDYLVTWSGKDHPR